MAMHQFPTKWRQTEKLGPRPIYTPLHSPLPKVGVSSHKVQGVKILFVCLDSPSSLRRTFQNLIQME